MKRLPSAFALGLLVSALLAACGSGDDAAPRALVVPPVVVVPQALDLTILHIDDHHCSLDSKATTLQLATVAGGSPTAVVIEFGGLPRVTAAIESLAQPSPNSSSCMQAMH